ncbi:MAG: GNAT family N-acetyltransferase [Candidatus Izemoplasmatales bacterium]
MEFRKVKMDDFDELFQIIEDQYYEENDFVVDLPDFEEINNPIKDKLKKVIKDQSMTGLYEHGQLLGFMYGLEIDQLWGNQKGILVPLFGHGAIKENRSRIYQLLYREMSRRWVSDGILSHAIKIHAHDAITVDTWFWLGFGHRCIDSIKILEKRDRENKDIDIKKINVSTADEVIELKEELSKHFSQPPLFMPVSQVSQEQSLEEFKEWLQVKDNHCFGAYDKDKPVGLIKVEVEGETHVSLYSKVMNITGLYVDPSYRGQAIAKDLLQRVQNFLKDKGYTLLGVDFESFNIDGGAFWRKHFIPYTYTLTRRIDEGILAK